MILYSNKAGRFDEFLQTELSGVRGDVQERIGWLDLTGSWTEESAEDLYSKFEGAIAASSLLQVHIILDENPRSQSRAEIVYEVLSFAHAITIRAGKICVLIPVPQDRFKSESTIVLSIKTNMPSERNVAWVFSGIAAFWDLDQFLHRTAAASARRIISRGEECERTNRLPVLLALERHHNDIHEFIRDMFGRIVDEVRVGFAARRWVSGLFRVLWEYGFGKNDGYQRLTSAVNPVTRERNLFERLAMPAGIAPTILPAFFGLPFPVRDVPGDWVNRVQRLLLSLWSPDGPDVEAFHRLEPLGIEEPVAGQEIDFDENLGVEANLARMPEGWPLGTRMWGNERVLVQAAEMAAAVEQLQDQFATLPGRIDQRRVRNNPVWRDLRNGIRGLRNAIHEMTQAELTALSADRGILNYDPARFAAAYVFLYAALIPIVLRIRTRCWGYRYFLRFPLPPSRWVPTLLYPMRGYMWDTFQIIRDLLGVLDAYQVLFRTALRYRTVAHSFSAQYLLLLPFSRYNTHTDNVQDELSHRSVRTTPIDVVLASLLQSHPRPVTGTFPENPEEIADHCEKAGLVGVVTGEMQHAIRHFREGADNEAHRGINPMYSHATPAWLVARTFESLLVERPDFIQNFRTSMMSRYPEYLESDTPSPFFEASWLTLQRPLAKNELLLRMRKDAVTGSNRAFRWDMLRPIPSPGDLSTILRIAEESNFLVTGVSCRSLFPDHVHNHLVDRVGLLSESCPGASPVFRSIFFQRVHGLQLSDLRQLRSDLHSWFLSFVSYLGRQRETAKNPVDHDTAMNALSHNYEVWDDQHICQYLVSLHSWVRSSLLHSYFHEEFGIPAIDSPEDGSGFILVNALDPALYRLFSPGSDDESRPRFFKLTRLELILEEQSLYHEFCLHLFRHLLIAREASDPLLREFTEHGYN